MSCRQLVASTLESNKKLSANELAIGVYGPWETLIRERRCRFWEWWADRFSLGGLSSMPPQHTFLLVAKFLFQKCLEREVVVIKDFHDDDPTSEQITSKDKGGAICILSLFLLGYMKSHRGSKPSDHSQTMHSHINRRTRTSVKSRQEIRSCSDPGY